MRQRELQFISFCHIFASLSLADNFQFCLQAPKISKREGQRNWNWCRRCRKYDVPRGHGMRGSITRCCRWFGFDTLALTSFVSPENGLWNGERNETFGPNCSFIACKSGFENPAGNGSWNVIMWKGDSVPFLQTSFVKVINYDVVNDNLGHISILDMPTNWYISTRANSDMDLRSNRQYFSRLRNGQSVTYSLIISRIVAGPISMCLEKNQPS